MCPMCRARIVVVSGRAGQLATSQATFIQPTARPPPPVEIERAAAPRQYGDGHIVRATFNGAPHEMLLGMVLRSHVVGEREAAVVSRVYAGSQADQQGVSQGMVVIEVAGVRSAWSRHAAVERITQERSLVGTVTVAFRVPPALSPASVGVLDGFSNGYMNREPAAAAALARAAARESVAARAAAAPLAAAAARAAGYAVPRPASPNASAASWRCTRCTFASNSLSSAHCEVCSNPRNVAGSAAERQQVQPAVRGRASSPSGLRRMGSILGAGVRAISPARGARPPRS